MITATPRTIRRSRSGSGRRVEALGFAPCHPRSAPPCWCCPSPGAALLVAAEFSTLYDVRVVTAVPEGGSFSAGGHHGYAQGLIARRGSP